MYISGGGSSVRLGEIGGDESGTQLKAVHKGT